MVLITPLLTTKDLMKTKLPSPKPEKAPREPRCECRQTNYSAGALLMMEQATGMRFARASLSEKPPAPAAVAAD
jgi:hypothetical protein